MYYILNVLIYDVSSRPSFLDAAFLGFIYHLENQDHAVLQTENMFLYLWFIQIHPWSYHCWSDKPLSMPANRTHFVKLTTTSTESTYMHSRCAHVFGARAVRSRARVCAKVRTYLITYSGAGYEQVRVRSIGDTCAWGKRWNHHLNRELWLVVVIVRLASCKVPANRRASFMEFYSFTRDTIGVKMLISARIVWAVALVQQRCGFKLWIGRADKPPKRLK